MLIQRDLSKLKGKRNLSIGRGKIAQGGEMN